MQVFYDNTVPADCNNLALRTKDAITKYTGPTRVFRCVSGPTRVFPCGGTQCDGLPTSLLGQ